MFRYIALVWDEADHAQTEAARLLANRLSSIGTWSPALQVPGMHVFQAGSDSGSARIHRLDGTDVVLLGTVFAPCIESNESALPTKTFSAAESRRILASGCRDLITQCWGRYVAFGRDITARRTYVLRDPSGGLPCYRTVFRGVHLYFSFIEDLIALDLLQFTVNWDYMTARVAFMFLHTRKTALNEVTEVLPGERIQISPGALTYSFVWDPLQIAQTRSIEDVQAATQTLHQVTLACVRSWGTCFTHVLHRLSGGLDSSIVLGCLQNGISRPTITCLNYYSAGSNSDERAFARLAAKRAGVTLLERERSTAMRIEEMLNITRSPSPTFYLGALQTSRREALLAREIGATAYFGGVGGDHLFYQGHGMLAAADFLRRHGWKRRFVEVALDTAHLQRCSIWHVMREAHKLRRSLPPWSDRPALAAGRKLVADPVIAVALERGGFTHPLFESVPTVPPGKLSHAYAISMPVEFYDPLGRLDDPEPVHPLLSQPLLEVCLRIPTYVLMNAGWDRALARQAFRTEVPREILRRRSKGGMEETVQEILARNLATARELLLDGRLMQAGLLDRKRVEQVLSDKPTALVSATAEVFDHLGVEIWLRRWLAA